MGGNVSFFRMGGGAALDTLLLAALREREPRARAAAVEALEARLAEETPFVPVARVREEAFYRRELHAVRFHPAYGLDLAGVWRAP